MLPTELEPVSARGWPATQSDSLGDWRLYASRGISGRLNTCWALGAPDRPVQEAIDAVEAWYAARGFAPRFKLIVEDTSVDLASLLSARGYQPDRPTLTMVGPLAAGGDSDVALLGEPNANYCVVFADAAFGHADDAAERLEALAQTPTPRAFALLRQDGVPAAVGACVVEGDFAGVVGMRTAPAFRRRGLARRVFRSLTDFARAAGASQGYLQVEESNGSAVALYRSEGFQTAYAYSHWLRRSPAPL
ncbi:MAG TPA: GNAT family N-acetyltransferase [Caulobacteraceae bacterium]|jgi:ribosomal protein S18 acetylase RimI-like enzyme